MPVEIKHDMWKRSFAEINKTYELQKKLAEKLKRASKEERINSNLYTSAYDDFFSQLPGHPVIKLKKNPKATAVVVSKWMKTLEPFLKSDATFLEIGAGDCSLSIEIAKQVNKVYALEVSNEAIKKLKMPENLELVIPDGITIPVPDNSVDIAYSNQLMEHLHPDDAFEQLQNIYQALSPGGIYVCITPNCLSGPHDISKFFDEIATGWHLKEYTLSELYGLFRQVGFSKVSYYKIRNGFNVEIPLNLFTLPLIKLCETIIAKLPHLTRRRLALMLLFNGITIVGTK